MNSLGYLESLCWLSMTFGRLITVYGHSIRKTPKTWSLGNPVTSLICLKYSSPGESWRTLNVAYHLFSLPVSRTWTISVHICQVLKNQALFPLSFKSIFSGFRAMRITPTTLYWFLKFREIGLWPPPPSPGWPELPPRPVSSFEVRVSAPFQMSATISYQRDSSSLQWICRWQFSKKLTTFFKKYFSVGVFFWHRPPCDLLPSPTGNPANTLQRSVSPSCELLTPCAILPAHWSN